MECKNTILDDISGAIGYAATTVLSAWYGGKSIYIPAEMHEAHPLCRLLGESAARRLSAAFPSENVFIPQNALYYKSVKHRNVLELFACGVPVDRIASVLNLTPNQIKNIRIELEDMGLMPKILSDADRIQC